MKNIFRAAGGYVAQTARVFRFYASGGAATFTGTLGTLIRFFLSGSKIDWGKRAGKVYDNSAAFIGINWICRQLSYARLMVQERQTGDKAQAKWVEIPHELPDLFEAGPVDLTAMLFGVVLSYHVDGNAYLIKRRAPAGNVLDYVYVPHFQVEPMADKYNDDGAKLISYYRYTPLGGIPEELAVEDVIHIRNGIDPERPRRGLSPLMAALREVVTDNEAATIGVALLLNGGIAGVAISPKIGKANYGETPEKRQEFVDKWRRNSTGDMAGTPNALQFPADINLLGYSPDKLVLSATRALAVSRILASIGIDPMVLGLPSEQKTYSNFKEAVEAAYESTLLPLMKAIAAAFTRQGLLIDFPQVTAGARKLRVAWDVSEVRALEQDKDAMFERLSLAYTAGWVTRLECKREAGYEFDPARDDVYSTDVMNDVAAAKSLRDRLAARAKAGRAKYEAAIGEDEEEAA